MTGLLVQLKPFVAQLWAALYCDRGDRETIYTAQVSSALLWLRTLFISTSHMFAIRHFKPPRVKAVISTDASPEGGGALLHYLPADVAVSMELLSATQPWAWISTRWTEIDERRAGASIGDAGGQARWEAYMAVGAIKKWAGPALEARGGITVVGDALGVMFGASVLRSKDRRINMLLQELALVFAPRGFSLDAVHVWSEDNAMADYLSRMKAESEIPVSLKGVSRTSWFGPEPWLIV